MFPLISRDPNLAGGLTAVTVTNFLWFLWNFSKELILTFLVDEKFENYEEIYTWLRGLGFPGEHGEYSNLTAAGRNRFPTQGKGNENTNAGREGSATPQGPIMSDATLSILSAKNNVIKEVRFRDVYPTNIGELQYDQQAGDVQYLTASVTFNYRGYDFANVGASSTTVTTS